MREDHLFYTTGKGLSSSKDDSKHTFVTQDKTAGRWLREKPGVSLNGHRGAPKTGSVGKAGAALRRNRRPSVPTLLDSRAKRGKKGFLSPETGTAGTDAPGIPRTPPRGPAPAAPRCLPSVCNCCPNLVGGWQP